LKAHLHADRKTNVALGINGYYAYLDEARRMIDLELSTVTSKIPDLKLDEKIR
jgi:hypothetical protein